MKPLRTAMLLLTILAIPIMVNRAYAEEGTPLYIGWPDATFTTESEVTDKYAACDPKVEYAPGDICYSEQVAKEAWTLVDSICTEWDDGVCVGAESEHEIFDEASSLAPMTVSCFDGDGSCFVEGGEAAYKRNGTVWCVPSSGSGTCPDGGPFHSFCCVVMTLPGRLPQLHCSLHIRCPRPPRTPWPPP